MISSRKPSLPPATLDKLQRLEDIKQAAHGAQMPVTDRIDDVRAERRRLSDRARTMRQSMRGSDSDELREIEGEIARLDAEIDRLGTVRDGLAAAHQTAAAPVARCREWLRANPNATLRHAPAAAPKAGVDHRLEVDRLRSDLLALDIEAAEVGAAPAPASDLRRRALGALDELAQRGQPALDARVRDGDPARLAEALMAPGVVPPVVNPAFVTWALRDVLAAKIAEAFATDQPGAMTDAARSKRLTALAAQRLEIERAEEAAIVSAAAGGLSIARRGDADPRAVLECEVLE